MAPKKMVYGCYSPISEIWWVLFRVSHTVDEAQYGAGVLPEYITYINALDEFQVYFVNPYIDHHCHEFLSE
jgi:hypothetical protein